MGQAGSAPTPPLRARRAHTLPHDPRHAPKVLPSLTESPRLRSTDNGAILHSGGTISGRRPVSNTCETSRPSYGQGQVGVYRSRSAGAMGETSELRARERDPLHRSHTNLDLRHGDSSSVNKRFGSEPDLRIEEPPKQKSNNKHFRKKYRAPPPPVSNHREGSSPESSDGNSRIEPQKKLRLFKTRNETKKLNGLTDTKQPSYTSTYTDYKSLDCAENQEFERRYKSPCKDKEQHFRYPDNKDMVQSSASLKREEHLLEKDHRKTRVDRMSGCRAKSSKVNEQNETCKTPLFNRNFRYSERFKKEENKLPLLRREKTFDNTLIANENESNTAKATHEKRMKAIGEELKGSNLKPKTKTIEPLRKSLPSLLHKNTEEKDEFQAELKKATSRIRNEVGNKVNLSDNKTSHNDKINAHKPNPSKTTMQNKVKESSLAKNLSNKQETKITNNRRPFSRINEIKSKPAIQQSKTNDKNTPANNKEKIIKEKINNVLPDRGQASGKESTPEHSPTRMKTTQKTQVHNQSQNSAPSKQFYFGMIESKHSDSRDHLKDFPGLGSPIIEEISNFHLIEKKLLGYHEEDAEFEKFNAKLKEDCKTKNLSSESALSSEGSEGSGSEGSLGIAVRLRPTPPKKHPTMPHFSPSAAWRQLASLDAHLAAQTQPLAVETKVSEDISPESSPRSEQSADKSGDSGISGDHANSDHRIESPTRHHVSPPEETAATWTPQQDLGDTSSDGTGNGVPLQSTGLVTYSPGAQPFSLSLPRDQDKFKGMSCFYECFQGKQLQQGFNSLQKLRKSVSGALGALGSRRFDLEHELEEPEQNWFLTKSAPNSLSNPLLFQQSQKVKGSNDDIKEEDSPPSLPLDKDNLGSWKTGNSYVSWGGHVMYLPPGPLAPDQPLSMLGPIDRPVRSKSSGSLEVSARAARAALATEMRERDRSASPELARALPARVDPTHRKPSASSQNKNGRGKRFTFQSTVRQVERRRLAERLSREADLKEQQRRTEMEAMRRVEEEFQRKRAREKASIRQQLRLVSSGAASMPHTTHYNKPRASPDGSCRMSPAPAPHPHSNASSEISARSKSTTPVRSVEVAEWRTGGEARVYRDWTGVGTLAIDHPPACARMPKSAPVVYNAAEGETFSGSPRSDNYRLEFARGRSPRTPRTPRAPRLLPAARTPSSSGSELSLRQPIKIREATKEESEEPAIVPTLRPAPAGPARPAIFIH